MDESWLPMAFCLVSHHPSWWLKRLSPCIGFPHTELSSSSQMLSSPCDSLCMRWCYKGRKTNSYSALGMRLDKITASPKWFPLVSPPHSTLCPSKGTNVTGDVLQHSGCLDAIRQRCWASIAMQQFNCGKTAASSKGGKVSVHLLSLFNPSQTCANEHKREKRERGEKEGKKGDEKEEEMMGKVLIQRSWPFCQPNTWSSWGLPCISALFLTFSSQFLSFLFPIHQTSLRASPGISLLCNVCLLHDPLSIKKFLLL